MHKNLRLSVFCIGLMLLATTAVEAQRGGGNRGGGNRGGGGGSGGNRGGGQREPGNRGGGQRTPGTGGGGQRAPGQRDNLPRDGADRPKRPERPNEPGKNLDRGELKRDGSNRPRPNANNREGVPTRSELENFLNRGDGNRTAGGKIGPKAVQGIENRGPQRLDTAERGNLKNNVAERGERVRGQIDHNYPHWDFWKDHPDWARYRWNRPYRWATWTSVNNWFGWSAPYVNYVYGDNLYYNDGNVYYDETQIATDSEYAQQAEEYAQAGEEALKNAGDKTEWMSLGVFALVHEKNEKPHMFFQLSVDNAGAIAGTYHDSTTGDTKNVHGLVVKESQRACWSVEGKPDNVVETGIYNLTQDQTECLMHFGAEHTQTWLLVRMEEPKDAAKEGDQAE